MLNFFFPGRVKKKKKLAYTFLYVDIYFNLSQCNFIFKMLVVIFPVFGAEIKIILGYNFGAL